MVARAAVRGWGWLGAALLIAGATTQFPALAADPTPRQSAPIKLAGLEFPPYYEMSKGRLQGPLAEVLTKVWAEAGYRFETAIYPGSRLMDNLARGETHSSLIVRNPMLDDSSEILRSPRSLALVTLNLYSVDKPVVTATLSDLRNQKVIVIRGYGYGGLKAWMDRPEQGIEAIDANNFESAVRMLEAKRAPLALLYDVNFRTAVKRIGAKPENVFENPFLDLPVYIYLHRSATPDPAATMERLMAAYDALVERGELLAPTMRPEEVVGEVPKGW